MAKQLEGKKIACLATNGFEFAELSEPRLALEDAGAVVEVIAPDGEEIQGMEHLTWRSDPVPVDKTLDRVDPGEYDGLFLPGGVVNPDQLRLSQQAIAFIKDFVAKGKPIAAICHGPWTLIDAGAVKGKTVTSWPSLQADLQNAGARWVDKEVIRDGKLVTSRRPDDIPAFNEQAIELFAA